MIPVDSEHSASFSMSLKEVDDGLSKNSAHRIRRALSYKHHCEKLGALVTPEVKRAIIQTGKWAEKISVDSATMMNKGLEIIEAQFFIWAHGKSD